MAAQDFRIVPEHLSLCKKRNWRFKLLNDSRGANSTIEKT